MNRESTILDRTGTDLAISLIDSNGCVRDLHDIQQRRKINGLCPTCPNRLYKISNTAKFLPIHGPKIPINNEQVYNGRCLHCQPLSKTEQSKPTKELLTVSKINQHKNLDGAASDGEDTSARRSNGKKLKHRSSKAGLFSSGTFTDDLVRELKDDIEKHNIAAPKAVDSNHNTKLKDSKPIKGNVQETVENIKIRSKVEDAPIAGSIDERGQVISQENIEKRRKALGLCVTCPNQLYFIKRHRFRPLKKIRTPITNEHVRDGRCLDCNPISRKIHINRFKTMHLASKAKAHRRRNKDDHGSDDEATGGKRNRRTNHRSKRASLFSSGTFADDLVGKLTEDIEIAISQSPDSNSSMKPDTDKKVMKDGTKQVAGESIEKDAKFLEPSSESIKKDVETKPSAKECCVPETSELSDKHYDCVYEAILDISTKPLELCTKIALCDYLVSLCRDHDGVKVEIVMNGGLMAIHKLMTDEHVMDDVLQEKTLTLLELVLPNSDYSLLRDIPIIEAITCLMLYHPTCLKIQEMAVPCLIIFCHMHDDFKTLIRGNEACELALAAMYNHQSVQLQRDVPKLIDIL